MIHDLIMSIQHDEVEDQDLDFLLQKEWMFKLLWFFILDRILKDHASKGKFSGLIYSQFQIVFRIISLIM